MKTIHAANELDSDGRPACVAIGVFDGVHLGHQRIIQQTIADARQCDGVAVVVTFDRHPNSVVAPARVPPLIYALPRKLGTIESLGADALLLIHFDEAFSQQSGEVFIRNLARDLGRIHSLCVGADFTFGRKRQGNVALLETLGKELGFAVRGLPAVALDGEPVSSTRIREAVRAGNFDLASRMLGRPYTLAGVVIPGDHLGNQLGFPTANLDTSGLVLPPGGVYAARATLDSVAYEAVLNIGRRPTLQNPDPPLRVEAHLLDFNGDLYGKELEIAFVEKLREERKFDSLGELRDQIGRDIEQARVRH